MKAFVNKSRWGQTKHVQPVKVNISKTQLVNIAIESVKQRQNLSMFWEYVDGAKKIGILNTPYQTIGVIISEYEDLIYGKGFQQRDYMNNLPDRVSTYEIGSARSGEIAIIERQMPLVRERIGGIGYSSNEELLSAEGKAKQLVKMIAEEFGWRQITFGPAHYHPELQLTIMHGASVKLLAGSGMKPCLSPAQATYRGYVKEDLVAALMVACVVDESFADHISRFWCEFKPRWLAYKVTNRIK